MADFRQWGGTLPASDNDVVAYIAALAEHYAIATIARRLAAISVAHEAVGAPNPARSPLVRATMRGIRRVHGVAQRQARPLLRDELFAVLEAMGERTKDVRDRALLLLGFAGGFRRSDLCGLDLDDLQAVREGLVVNVRRSKTDQEAAGRKIGIPLGRTAHCPVAAAERWITVATIAVGPVFRPVHRHGRVQPGSLSGEAVRLIIRERVAAVGLDPASCSGHSLRAGFATSAAIAGVASRAIRRQTGHASDAMLARYVQDGELFNDNAAGVLPWRPGLAHPSVRS